MRTQLASLFLVFAVNVVAAPPPNLLVIQTDEHNFRTLGCYRDRLPVDQAEIWGPGVVVETPNIDWIARNGALAERFYATSPVCTPSRASFMTGRYPQNTGAISNNLPMKDEMVTFAEVFRRAGYATGYAGKWHLDGPGRPQFAPARKFGWDDNRYLFNRGHWKKLVENESGAHVGAVDGKGNPTYELAGADEKSFTTDFLVDRAVAFIRSHRDKPFCYMVSLPDPHGPNTVRPPYDTMFNQLAFQQPQSATRASSGLPRYADIGSESFKPAEMARYFGMVKCIDDGVGRILEALRVAGVLENTCIVFTSDHGDLCGEHGRQDKGHPMEGSARIPFVIYAPGLVRPGTIMSDALGTVDFMPTILGLFGVPGSDGCEGRDASPAFRAGREEAKPAGATFVRIGTHESANAWMGVFTFRHKLVVAPYADPCLIDLETDPDEKTNLWSSPRHRELVRSLAGELERYAQVHNDPIAQSVPVRSDLTWAISGQGPYVSPLRAAPKVRPENAHE
jgi:arylsulfatase A-like enzyme